MNNTASGELQSVAPDGCVDLVVLGLGYVGLPLARAFAANGFKVLGFDVDAAKVAQLADGKSYIRQIPDEAIRTLRRQRFEATDRFDRLDEPDTVQALVVALVDKSPTP